jgi:hypothetical protein
MVDKDQELLRFVKEKKISKMLIQPNFPEQVYREIKNNYFSGDLIAQRKFYTLI